MKIIRDRPQAVDLDEFLARPLFAHLATDSEHGPRDSPVWFLWENEALWIIGSRETNTFPDRIEREPRCAVGVVDFDRKTGLVHHMGFRGRGKVVHFDPGRARRLLRRYLGEEEGKWDPRFRATLSDPSNVFVRVDSETAVARDVSYDSPYES